MGYSKSFDNGKPVNLYVSAPAEFWKFWEYSIGIDVNIKGYGGGIYIGSEGGAGSQNSKEIGKGLMKNKAVSKQFGKLFKATNDYASGTISKRGMTGIFNLYGKEFISTVSRALPSTVAKLTAKNLGKLGVTTILSGFAGTVF